LWWFAICTPSTWGPVVSASFQQAGQFVGRHKELIELGAALDAGVRLVSVVGPGGIGKTRLVGEYLRRRHGGSPHSAIAVDLSHAHTWDGVVARIARAAGVGFSCDVPAADQIARALAGRGGVVIVLDGVESITDAAVELVGAWRHTVPNLRVVVTSHAALGINGERRVDLPPLPTKDGRALFVQRAREHADTFTDPDGPTLSAKIDEIVNWVDGLPLAIELAAAHAAAMPLPALATRLADGLSVLKPMWRDLPRWQATMAATVEWSWRQLSADEQRAFVQCGAFRGSFSPAAADAVLSPGARPNSERLTELVKRSLLYCVLSSTGELRYRMYKTLRQFAAVHVAHASDGAAILERHLQYYARVAERFACVSTLYRGTTDDSATALADLEELLAALRAAQALRPAAAARLGLAVVHLLGRVGPRDRVLRIAEDALAAARSAGDDAVTCRVLLAQAIVRRLWHKRGDVLGGLQAAAELQSRCADSSLAGYISYEQALAAAEAGAVTRARTLYQRALERVREDDLGLALVHDGLAVLDARVANYRAALHHYGCAIRRHRAADNPSGEATSRRNRAVIYSELGEAERALADHERALDAHVELGVPQRWRTFIHAGAQAAQLGRFELANSYAGAALAAARAGELTPRLGDPFRGTAMIRVFEHNYAAAEQLLSEGLAWQARHHRGPGYAQSLLARGLVRLVRGALYRARSDLQESFELLLPGAELVNDGPVAAGFLAVVEHLLGHGDRAWPLWAFAQQRARRWRTLRLERCLRALEPCFGGRGPGARPALADKALFADELIARVFTERAAAGGSRPQPTFYVGPQLRWVKVPYGAHIDLGRRPVLRRLVTVLLEARLQRPGQPVSSRQLIARIWPEDRSAHGVLENRLWVALSSARKLGLDGLLQRGRGGYFFDPAVAVREHDPPALE
jgi:predicted ATPase